MYGSTLGGISVLDLVLKYCQLCTPRRVRPSCVDELAGAGGRGYSSVPPSVRRLLLLLLLLRSCGGRWLYCAEGWRCWRRGRGVRLPDEARALCSFCTVQRAKLAGGPDWAQGRIGGQCGRGGGSGWRWDGAKGLAGWWTGLSAGEGRRGRRDCRRRLLYCAEGCGGLHVRRRAACEAVCGRATIGPH